MEAFKKQILAQSGIALGAAILLVIAIQLIAPKLERVAVKIQDQKSDLAFLSQSTNLLPQLKSDLEKAQPLINELNRVLPPKEQMAGFEKELADLAKKVKIGISFSKVGDSVATGDAPGFTQFLMTSNASYGNFLKFLKEVKKSRFFVKINSLNMTRQGSADKYNIAANAQAFYQ